MMNSRRSLCLTKLPHTPSFGEETAEPLRRQGNVSTSQLLINLSTIKSAIVVSMGVENLQEEERENVVDLVFKGCCDVGVRGKGLEPPPPISFVTCAHLSLPVDQATYAQLCSLLHSLCYFNI